MMSHDVPLRFVKMLNVSAGKVTLGIPGMARAKQIITDYYIAINQILNIISTTLCPALYKASNLILSLCFNCLLPF